MSTSDFNGGFVPRNINRETLLPALPSDTGSWGAVSAGAFFPYYSHGPHASPQMPESLGAAAFAGESRMLVPLNQAPYFLYAESTGTGNVPLFEQFSAPIVPALVRAAADRAAEATAGRRPLRVVHIGPHLQRGGAEQWLLDLAGSLDPSVMQVVRHVTVQPDAVDYSYVTELMAANISVEVGGADAVQAAARDADVLLSWGVQLDRYLGNGPRPPSLQIVHGDGPWNRWFLEGSRRSVDHFVAVSHRVQEIVCHDVPSTVIYNGIDGRRLARSQGREETRQAFGFQEQDLVVAYCGRLAKEKRIDRIITAVAALPSHVTLLLIGTGYMEQELRELAEQTMPGRAVFTSTRNAAGDLYAAADIFCMASDQEGCSLALLEAMLSGLPAVTTPVGCAAELIEDRVTGLLFDGTPADLTRALSLLTDHRDWRHGMAAGGRRVVERFGYARRMARDYQRLVHGLC